MATAECNSVLPLIPILCSLLLLAASAVVGVADAFCPQQCKCQTEGVSGIDAHCTELTDEQFFLKPVQHLTIVNENKTQMALTADIFAKVGLKHLESIQIVNSSLTEINVNAFNGLTALFDVNLADNRLFLIHPDTFANNSNLHHLKLSGNPLQLTQLLLTPHEYLLRSTSLTEFDVSFCQLSQILPQTFSQMRNLIFLNLSWNYLKTLPREVFRDLVYLEELDVSYNSIGKIDKDTFRHNGELSVLKLKKNPIDFMNGINITKLEELDMSECKLSILMRESLEGMPGVMNLNFSYNKIEILSDDAFVDLQALKRLDLSYNNLVGPLPRGIFKKNYELETLSVSGNTELKTLVEGDGFIGNHLALVRLDAASCGLTALNGTPFAGMNSLSILNLNDNALRGQLDANLFANLTRLSQLDLSNNFIDWLSPTQFDDNPQLVKLTLSGNPILQLSVATFASLSNLKVLDVSNCHLNRMWDNHKHALKEYNVFSNLAHLDMSDNNLKNLHVNDFSTLTRLEKIDLTGNPLECLKPTIDAIEWMVNQQVDPYYEKKKTDKNQQQTVITTTLIEEDKFRWNKFVNDICSSRVINSVETAVNNQHRQSKFVIDEETNDRLLSTELKRHRDAEEDLGGVVTYGVENDTTSSSNNIVIWQTIFVISAILMVVYLIVYFVAEMISRRRNNRLPTSGGPYIKPGTLGGHILSRASNNGSPLYYKLYEECSIPTEPPNKKGSIFISWAPIHTFLKRGSYKIMKNNEVHL